MTPIVDPENKRRSEMSPETVQERTDAENVEIARNSLLEEREKLRRGLAEIDDQRAHLRWQSDSIRRSLIQLNVKIDNFERDLLLYATSNEDLGFGTWHIVDITTSPFVLLNLSMDQESCLTWLKNFGLGGGPDRTKRMFEEGTSLEEMLNLRKENAEPASPPKELTLAEGVIQYEELDEQGKPKSLSPVVKTLRVIYTPPSKKTVFPDLHVE